MADLTIGDLSPATELADADKLEIELGEAPDNSSAHITLGRLRAYAQHSPENVQTGTSYTLVLTDAFKLVALNNASPNEVTVPSSSAVAFPIGTRVDLSQDGAGQMTIVADSGVTIRTPETLKIRKQWGKATLIKRATNTWDLEGNLEATP